MNIRFLLFFTVLFLGVFGCSKEEQIFGGGEISIKLSTDNSVIGTVSRAVEEKLPNIGDFGVSIANTENGEVVASWDKFSQFEKVAVEPGLYTVSASYGNAAAEGFETASYEGNTSVTVINKQTAETTVVCTLNKAKIAISYTENFKKYFSSYCAFVTSSKDVRVDYTADETRAAYFVPGELKIFLEVLKDGVEDKVILNPKTIQGEARHEYRLTMDVDASTATLNVIFNDEPANEENVTINVSDEILSAPAPVFTLHGFQSGVAIETIEGNKPINENNNKFDFYLNAQGGIENLIMTAQSSWWTAQGLPEQVDLTNLEGLSTYTMGLTLTGLGEKRDKIALVDLSSLLGKLLCKAETDEEHVFTFTATDKMTKISKDPVVVKVLTKYNQFSVTAEGYVALGDKQLVLSVSALGATDSYIKSTVKYSYWAYGQWKSLSSSKVKVLSTDKVTGVRKVQLTLDESFDDVKTPVKIKAVCGNHNCEVEFQVKQDLDLSVKDEADVWAAKAILQLTPVGNSDLSVIPSDKVKMQYRDGSEWKDLTYVYAENEGYTVTGLTPGKEYMIRGLYVDDNKNFVSNVLEICTEQALQLPNSGMEEWSSVAGTNNWWYKWYPWKSEVSKGWNTINEKTTADGGDDIGNSYAYIANSGTIQTESSNTGQFAALIRTIGWGKGTTAPGKVLFPWDGKMAKVDPGFLYLGEYTETPETVYTPYPFTVRPTGLSFYYKYYPAAGRKTSDDNFEILIRVECRTGDETVILAEKSIKEGGKVEKYAFKEISLDYVDTKHKATHIYVMFKSGSVTEYDYFLVPPYNDLSDGEYVGSQLYIDDIKLIYE